MSIKKNNPDRAFARRTAITFFVVVLMFLSCILRVAVVATGNYAEVQTKQSRLKITSGTLRGTIYDCNMAPMTNRETKILAAVSPTPRAITGISSYLPEETRTDIINKLKRGNPVVCEVPEMINCDGIVCSEVYIHNSAETPAIHLVGYTDTENHGVSGLEAAYDELLYSEKTVDFIYTKDGKGKILSGIAANVENDTSVVAGGVVSTIDVNIQNIAESVSSELKRGAVVVSEASTGKIRAMVSCPDYDVENIIDYLDREDSPLLNRAVSCYNVGSVFKPCVAAAGLENRVSSFCYTCKGNCEIAGRIFNCHNRAGHGAMDLKSALAFSCNTFFYNFALNMGGNAIYKMASSLGFGEKQVLCDGLSTAQGSLPEPASLKNDAALANLSIGQGTLSVSPAAMQTLYCSIASNGTYYNPSVVEGTLKDGVFTEYKRNLPTRVMSEKTASLLREYLAGVITEGTGTAAQPLTCTAAGKTATAQTGKFVNGVEICEGWFCGFFPAENPKYVVIVFSENIALQSVSCAQIFSKIADEITLFEGE